MSNNCLMSNNENVIELIIAAKETTDSKKLADLARHVNSSVRRAVARNIHTDSETIHLLLYDPAANVSVPASKHNRCFMKRKFLDDVLVHRCVICDFSEIECFNKTAKCS